jgi:hypothetical protein
MDNKRSWNSFLIRLGKCTLVNITHTRKEVLALKEIMLCTGTTKNHDPKKVVHISLKDIEYDTPFQTQNKGGRIIFP